MASDLVIKFLGDTKELNAKIDELKGKLKGVGETSNSAGSKIATGLKAAGVAAVGIVGAIAVSSIKLADTFEDSHARLVVALKNTGTSFGAVKGQVDALVKSGAGFGYTATDIQGTLAQMTTGLGSVNKATGAFGVVEDLAAAKGIPLAQAGLLVTKAMEGQLRPLKQMGIDLPIAAGGAVKVQAAQVALVKATQNLQLVEEKIHDGRLKGVTAADALTAASSRVTDAQGKLNTAQSAGNNILAALGQKLDGSAAAAADTFSGKAKALKAQLENVQIQIGTWLIPKLEKLITVTESIVSWFGKHHDAAIALAVVVGGVLLAATVAWVASLFAADGALAILVSPIAAVVAGVAALALGVIYLWNHWDQIWNWIWHHKAYAGIVAVLLPPVAAVLGLIAAAKAVADNWPAIWNTIENIAIGAANVIGGVLNQIIRGINDTIQGLNDINPFSNIPKIPTVGSLGHVSLPPTNTAAPIGKGGPVKRFATGGIVTRPTFGLFGEAGPEAVIPLKRGIGGGGLGATVNINVTIDHPTGNGREIADELVGALRTGYARGEIRRQLGIG